MSSFHIFLDVYQMVLYYLVYYLQLSSLFCLHSLIISIPSCGSHPMFNILYIAVSYFLLLLWIRRLNPQIVLNVRISVVRNFCYVFTLSALVLATLVANGRKIFYFILFNLSILLFFKIIFLT